MIGIFSERAKLGESLPVVQPGTQKRNFTHIDDIISGLRLIAENGYGDEFGIGADESYTIKEIAQLFGGKIEILPERRGNRLLGEVITDKTKNLGWSQKNTLKDFIKNLNLRN